jgi:glycosyltransferase involved in cell wall biosynthesis
VNLVEALGDEFEFRIIAFDHDLGDSMKYSTAHSGRWVEVGKALVWYVPAGLKGLGAMIRVLRRTRADVIYVNSFFAPLFSLLPVVLAAILPRRSAPLVVAPRGELSGGALRFKAVKKAALLEIVRWVGLYRRESIIFQSSTPAEADDIRQQLTRHVKTLIAKPLSYGRGDPSPAPFPRIVTAQDLASVEPGSLGLPKAKERGCLRIAWISRIVRKKNLDGALGCVKRLTGNVRFTIYGPDEDREYWIECQRLMSELPANVQATYAGVLRHEDVVRTLETQDVLLFPTYGENYGHVILEALTAGCPIVISDQTPWRGLAQAGIGWDIALDNPAGFVAALQTCVDMDRDAFESFSKRARAFGADCRDDPTPIEQHRHLFRSALALREHGVTGAEAA